jgi:hypothetical protein
MLRYSIVTMAVLLGLESSPAYDQPDKVLYELQERCGKQAAKFFAAEYKPVTNVQNGQMLSNYENHYSPKLNKCFFLEITETIEKRGISESMRLFDLNENKEYGAYFKAYSGKVMQCEVRDQICRSDVEWRQLAKPYLED